MRLYLVRHANVAVRPDRPASQWYLSPEGRAAAETLAGEPYWANLRGLHASPEPKAVGTAQRIAVRHGLPIRIEPDLREVGRRTWVGKGYRELARSYLQDEADHGWESRDAALRRVRACIESIVARHRALEAGVISHGLVLTLYLTDLLGLDATASYELWDRMEWPDVAVIDPEARRLERGFGAG